MIDPWAISTALLVATNAGIGIFAARYAEECRELRRKVRTVLIERDAKASLLEDKNDTIRALHDNANSLARQNATFRAAEAKRVAQRESARKLALAAVQRRKAARLAKLAAEKATAH